MATTTETNNLGEASPEVISQYKEIIKNNGVLDPIAEVIVKDSGLRGENMQSVTNYVTIKFKNQEKAPIHLFVKRQPISKGLNEMTDDAKVFHREAMFLVEYLPVAWDYCKSKGKEHLMSIYPKCYYGDGSLIVLENLVVGRGYCMLDKIDKQGMEAATLSLQNLAKHHAISYAVIMEKGGPNKFFKEYPYLKTKTYFAKAMKELIETCVDEGIPANIKILQKSPVGESKKAIQKLESMKDGAVKTLYDLLENDSGKFMILNHGDYWNNNMMFLKEPYTGKLIDHVAIDFQITYYGSPTLDLSYFFYTSVKHYIRRNCLPELLQLYLDCLKTTATELGHPIELTIEELRESYKKNFIFGFYFGNFIMSEVDFSVLKDVNVNEINNISELMEKFELVTEKYFERNPGKLKEFAKNITENMLEYEQLENGNF